VKVVAEQLNLDELERMAAAATRGPWIADDNRKLPGRDDVYVAAVYKGEPGGRICEVFENCLVRRKQRDANMAFIAAVRTAVPALIARIREVESERDALKKESDLRQHMVITCGVAARHPDPALTRTGAYAAEWNSQQAEDVRALRSDRDRLRGEVGAAVPEQWRTLVKELADELESEIIARYQGYPEDDRRFVRDLLTVREARALLASAHQTPLTVGA